MTGDQPETIFLHGDAAWKLGSEERELADAAAAEEIFRELIPVYQRAFAEPPWNERSQCPPDCQAGREFCDVHPGEFCERGQAVPESAAYPTEMMLERFGMLHQDDALFTIEYLGGDERRPVLGSVMWLSDAAGLAEAKYPDRPEMHDWLVDRFGERQFIYRDEVFADREARPSGNLRDYHRILEVAVEHFDCRMLVGRTVNVRLLGKLHKVYGERLTIFGPAQPPRGTNNPLAPAIAGTIREHVPDDRYLAIIELD
jgi:hypothetical protein